MVVVQNKPQIKKAVYQKFVNEFNKGNFGKKRLGEAFYEHFKLHRLVDQTQLHNIAAKDGEHAINSIKEIFRIV